MGSIMKHKCEDKHSPGNQRVKTARAFKKAQKMKTIPHIISDGCDAGLNTKLNLSEMLLTCSCSLHGVRFIPVQTQAFVF